MGDGDKVAIAKAELASLLNKKDQAHVVRARLKIMSAEWTNMAAELYTEELRIATDQYITCLKLLDGRTLMTDKGICGEFCDYFQKLFTREPGLSEAQLSNDLAGFPCLKATEAAHNREEYLEVLNKVRKDKALGIDGLPLRRVL